jgi:hypothetical protein
LVDLARKFRILADIVQTVENGKATSEDDVKTALASADLKRAQIESMIRLAKEFGFLSENLQHQLHATQEGLSFERYITAANSQTLKSESVLPQLDRGTELKVCLTIPPMWAGKINEQFGEIINHTLVGEKLVAEDAETSLIIVTPYLDVGTMQIALKDVYAKNAELIVVTSEPNLVRQYQSGTNFWLQKLDGLIRSRFRSGKVLFLSHNTSIAHAKVWCSDKSLLITSANVKPDSATDNLEVGIYTDDPETVLTMKNLLRQIMQMEGIQCLLKIPP